MFNHLREHDKVTVEIKDGVTVEARVDSTNPLVVIWYENEHEFDPTTGRTGRRTFPRLSTVAVVKFICPKCGKPQDAARRRVGTQFNCWVLCCKARLSRQVDGLVLVGESREFEVGNKFRNKIRRK